MIWDSALQTCLMISSSIIFYWKPTKQDYFPHEKLSTQNTERCKDYKIHVKFCPSAIKSRKYHLKDSNVTHHQKKKVALYKGAEETP